MGILIHFALAVTTAHISVQWTYKPFAKIQQLV